MSLEKQQVEALLSSVADTREDEIGCDECHAGMAEFAERELIGADVPTALRRIQAHIAFCPECTEEYELLLDMVDATSLGSTD